MRDYSTTLYVIFHGSWAFIENGPDPCRIYACAAKIPHHTFIAGSWLGETKFDHGARLTLTGVYEPKDANDCDSIRRHNEGFVLFEKKEPRPDLAYATVSLPRPCKYWPELVVPNTGATAPHQSNTSGDGVASANMGLVPVFEYKIGPGIPTLTQHDGTLFWIAPAEAPPSLATTLHFFAADDSVYGLDAKGDFPHVAEILGYKATIQTGEEFPAATRTVQTPGLRGGREFEVTTFLHERVSHLRSIGAQMQQRGANSLYAWEPPLYLKTPGSNNMAGVTQVLGDLSSCGGGGGGS